MIERNVIRELLADPARSFIFRSRIRRLLAEPGVRAFVAQQAPPPGRFRYLTPGRPDRRQSFGESPFTRPEGAADQDFVASRNQPTAYRTDPGFHLQQRESVKATAEHGSKANKSPNQSERTHTEQHPKLKRGAKPAAMQKTGAGSPQTLATETRERAIQIPDPAPAFETISLAELRAWTAKDVDQANEDSTRSTEVGQSIPYPKSETEIGRLPEKIQNMTPENQGAAGLEPRQKATDSPEIPSAINPATAPAPRENRGTGDVPFIHSARSAPETIPGERARLRDRTHERSDRPSLPEVPRPEGPASPFAELESPESPSNKRRTRNAPPAEEPPNVVHDQPTTQSTSQNRSNSEPVAYWQRNSIGRLIIRPLR